MSDSTIAHKAKPYRERVTNAIEPLANEDPANRSDLALDGILCIVAGAVHMCNEQELFQYLQAFRDDAMEFIRANRRDTGQSPA